jgi:hypothetical protein
MMKYYKISIRGYGGEVVFGKATKQQYEFWNDSERLEEAGFELASSAIVDYMWDMEEWEPNIPKTARFRTEWYELDDYGHYNGVTHDSAYVIIEEVDSEAYDANVIEKVWEGSLVDLLSQNKKTTIKNELDLNEEIQKINAGPYVFYGMSVEKGEFISGIVVAEKLDFSKLEFYEWVLPNGDTLVEDIEYNGEGVNNFGGDTSGKAMYMEVWDW